MSGRGGDWRGRGTLRYPEYLKVRELLSLQVPVSDPPHHDETLFIIAHQVFELWFKLLLHDLEALRGHLDRGELRPAFKLARRAAEVQRNLVDQVPMLETMSTLDFLEFRSTLEGASGFQSAQFRELEVLLGVRDEDRVPLAPGAAGGTIAPYLERLAPEERARIATRMGEPSMEEVFLHAVEREVVPSPRGRVYLQDVEDLVSSEALPHLLAAVGPLAEVTADAALSRLLERLAVLPAWTGLGPTERVVVLERARRGRLGEALRKHSELDPGSAEACEVKLLDEELSRRVTVEAEAVDAALVAGGLPAQARSSIATRLARRARLRQVYSRAAHAPGEGSAYELWLVAEALLDFAEAYQVFRFRHVKMVERMIGSRRGTGGSPGVAYLEQTLRYRVFPELWRVRTYL